MRIGIVVQARMNSARLPGKVLLPLRDDQPMLEFLFERLRRCRKTDLCYLATSIDPLDNALEDFCVRRGLACHRGPLGDVAARFAGAAIAGNLDAFVRISGDSPLLDPALVDRAIAIFEEKPCDLVTNVAVRSFPKGMSVELFKSSSFLAAAARFETAADREHVGPFFYRHAGEFDIRNFALEPSRSELQLSVDTPEDLQRIRAMVAAMTRPQWNYDLAEILELHDRVNGT